MPEKNMKKNEANEAAVDTATAATENTPALPTIEEVQRENAAKAKANIIVRLKAMNRPGIEKVIEMLDATKFWDAPASTSFHLPYEGGLAVHTMNVANNILVLADAFMPKLPRAERESLELIAILHDVGKANDYYVAHLLKNGSKGAKPFEVNKGIISFPHAIRSLMIVEETGFRLTDVEKHAILLHGGLYDELASVDRSSDENTVDRLLNWADMWASHEQETGDFGDFYGLWRDQTAAVVGQ